MNARPCVSVVIVTRNRREEALRAVESCFAQDYPELEVLVYDDASTDGTAAAVRSAFPPVRLFSEERRQGYITLRNRGFRDATGEFVLSLDDDAYLTDPGVAAAVVRWFEEHPQAAALALPFVEPAGEGKRNPAAAIPAGTPLRHYIGCAHALRRRVALELGGYPELLAHQGEERDLCIRLLDAGYQVLAVDTPPLVHRVSPRRDARRVNYFGYRNTLLFHWMRTPHPYLLPRMAIDSLQLARYQFSWRTLPVRAAALAAGWWGCLAHWRERRPVRAETYRRYRALPRPGPAAYVERLPDSIRAARAN